jgi:hypothetical protein
MPNTSLIPYGNNLLSPKPQAGWQVEADGFGLLQAQVKFKWDVSNAASFTTTFAKGTTMSSLLGASCPSNLTNLRIWKANYVWDKAGVLVVTADFCGIDPAVNGGLKTITQVVMTGSSASEPIEHHPNFQRINCPTGGMSSVLAGIPTTTGWDPSATTNPNRALWRPAVASGGATQGFQFVGFLPYQKTEELAAGVVNIKAGVKNYYKPSNTLRCLFYVPNETTAVAFASYVGWMTSGGVYQLPESYKDLATGGYGGSFIYSEQWQAKIRKAFLITNCSVEQFGGIYKVTADLMLSGMSGWDRDIYPNLDAP